MKGYIPYNEINDNLKCSIQEINTKSFTHKEYLHTDLQYYSICSLTLKTKSLLQPNQLIYKKSVLVMLVISRLKVLACVHALSMCIHLCVCAHSHVYVLTYVYVL